MTETKDPTAAVDLTDEKDVHWDFKKSMNYGDYLGLDSVLNAQKRRSDHHDEMLFIIIHQVSELWIKLVLHEVEAALEAIRNDDLEPCFKMLARVSKVQNQLKQSWDVLSTMTPADYIAFRDALGHSSGFQSYQYRVLEYLLGNKNAKMAEVHKHDKLTYALVTKALNQPSLYDESLRLLSRRGFQVPESKIDRDWSQPYTADADVEAVWAQVYQDTNTHWDLYALAEKLVDVEDNFQQWRFRHMTTVKRVIGFRKGTGGTSGVSYLSKALNLKFFPELWSVRTSL